MTCACGARPCKCHDRPEVHQTAGSRAQALQVALEQLSITAWTMVVDHDDEFVYFARDDEAGLRRRSYTEDDDGSVTLGDDEARVRPRTDFIAVQAEPQQEDGEMADDEKRAAAPPPEAAKGKEPEVQKGTESLEVRFAKLEAENEHLRAQLKAPGPATLDEYVKQAPTELRPALMSLVKAQRTRELEQIEAIKAAVPDLYTDEELRAMGADQLDKLVKVAQARSGYDYSVVANEQSRLATIDVDDENYAAMPVSPWDAPAGSA